MKKLRFILCLMILICVAGTVVFLILAPEQVPMHYNAFGEIDRIGSKYENVIWPLITAVQGVIFMMITRHEQKKGERFNEKILMTIGVCTLAFFMLLGFFFMWKAMRYSSEDVKQVTAEDVNRFTSIGIGAMLVILGNMMPKAGKNSLLGLRTKWSMANDSVWQKSQRFGGIVLVISGFLMIILSLFIQGLWNMLMMLIVLTAALILCTVASYRYYLADQK